MMYSLYAFFSDDVGYVTCETTAELVQDFGNLATSN